MHEASLCDDYLINQTADLLAQIEKKAQIKAFRSGLPAPDLTNFLDIEDIDYNSPPLSQVPQEMRV